LRYIVLYCKNTQITSQKKQNYYQQTYINWSSGHAVWHSLHMQTDNRMEL